MSLDERIARKLVDEDYAQAKLIAAGMGRPPGTKPTSDDKLLDLFMQADPSFDEQAAWAEHIQNGTDPWNAITDVALKKFPNRIGLMKSFGPRVSEQIDGINRLAKRAETRTQQQQQAAQTQQALNPADFVRPTQAAAPTPPPSVPPPIEPPY